MNRCRSILLASMMGFLFLFISNSLSAISSYSNADYLRTLNRFASVGTMDSMFFNPAGTVRMPDGIYIQGNVDFPIVSRSLLDLKPTYKTMGLGLPATSVGFVYKRAGSSVFVTLMPSVANGLKLPGLVVPPAAAATPAEPGESESDQARKKQEAASTTVIDSDYNFQVMMYELTAGGAFSFNDVVAMSFGARLIADIDTTAINYTFSQAEKAYREKYKNDVMTFGAAMHAGLLVTPAPWFAMSLNLHSGGFGIGQRSVVSKILPPSEEEEGGPKTTPSIGEKRPQEGGFIVRGLPARLDLGFLFDINDIMKLQLTGQARIQLFKNTDKGVTFDLSSISLGYSAGLGMDFKFTPNFTWGLGVLYSDDRIKDTSYYTPVDSLNAVRLRSITVGTGVTFDMGDMFGMSLSAAYPLYFTTENGFSVSDLTMPGGRKAKISDVLIAIGLNVKLDGLF